MKEQSKKFMGTLDNFSMVCILIGVVCLCQPFSMFLYQVGFPIVLAGTVGHNVFAHYI